MIAAARQKEMNERSTVVATTTRTRRALENSAVITALHLPRGLQAVRQAIHYEAGCKHQRDDRCDEPPHIALGLLLLVFRGTIHVGRFEVEGSGR